jgi:uncharacterized protein (DUF342 family)
MSHSDEEDSNTEDFLEETKYDYLDSPDFLLEASESEVMSLRVKALSLEEQVKDAEDALCSESRPHKREEVSQRLKELRAEHEKIKKELQSAEDYFTRACNFYEG